MKTANLIRWSGLAAIGAGIIFASIQPVHPPDVVSSVTTGAWAIITTLKWVMCFLFMAGLTGLYARQAEKAGWLGLVGYLLFVLSWFIQTGFVFAETFIAPLLAAVSPQFIDSYLGVASMQPGPMNVGVLVPLYGLMSALIIFGSVLFGIATFRAHILPRWPAALLAATIVFIPVAALLPHAIQRLVGAIPMGIAVAWLGLALFTERRAKSAEVMQDQRAARSQASKAA